MPSGFNTELSQLLENQEKELESRRTSMMTMEVLLTELNAERTAKNDEIQRLRVHTHTIVRHVKGWTGVYSQKQNVSQIIVQFVIIIKKSGDCSLCVCVCVFQAQLSEKENMRLDIQTLLEQFYNTQNQQSHNSSTTE